MATIQRLDTVVGAYTAGEFSDAWKYREMRLATGEQRILDLFLPDQTGAILTVGCGNGRETFALHDNGYRNVRGVDCTEALIEHARERSAQAGLRIPFDVASAKTLPYADEVFHGVTLFSNIYGHITPRAERLRSLREIYRVLKPGGHVLVNVNSMYHSFLAYVYIRVCDILRLISNRRSMEPGDKMTKERLFISHWFTPDEMRAEAREAGFETRLVTTFKNIPHDSGRSPIKYYRKGVLLCVFRKPVRTGDTLARAA